MHKIAHGRIALVNNVVRVCYDRRGHVNQTRSPIIVIGIEVYERPWLVLLVVQKYSQLAITCTTHRMQSAANVCLFLASFNIKLVEQCCN